MPVALGLRLVVGQQTLDLYAEVRLLQPQPECQNALSPDLPGPGRFLLLHLTATLR